MSRQTTLLSILGAVLLLVVAYLFLVKPQQDEITEIRAEIDTTQEQQSQVRAQIAQLEDIRATIPEVEAAIAAAETIVPRGDAKVPGAIRQLQMAANDSGVELTSVALARPTAITEPGGAATIPQDLASLSVTVTLSGGYYQVVDFLRRVEDPAITPRAILWSNAAVTLDEYPTLTTNLSGTMFAYLEDIGVEEPTPTQAETDADVDVDVDVDVTESETEEAA